MMHSRPRTTPAVAATLQILVAACGAPPTPIPSAAASGGSVSSSSTMSTGFPLTFDSCGLDVTVPAAPQRVLSFYPTMTEMMVALGLGDRLIGQVNTQYGTPSADYASGYAAVPVVSRGEPSAEAVIAQRPDLLLAEQDFRFDGKRLPTRQTYAADGIPVLVSQSLCAATKTTTTVPDTFTDIERLGRLFDVPDRAAALIDELRSRAGSAQQAVMAEPKVRLVVLSVYESALYVQAGGLYSDVVERAGGQNLITSADLPAGAYYAEWSPEAVLKLDPDVIVFAYNDDAGKAQATDYITGRLAATAAVRAGRVIGVPEPVFGGGVRSALGVGEVAKLLHPGLSAADTDRERYIPAAMSWNRL